MARVVYEAHTELWPGFSTVSLRPTDTFVCIGCSKIDAGLSLLVTDAARGETTFIELVQAPLELHLRLGHMRPKGTVLWSLPKHVNAFTFLGLSRVCVVVSAESRADGTMPAETPLPRSEEVGAPSRAAAKELVGAPSRAAAKELSWPLRGPAASRPATLGVASTRRDSVAAALVGALDGAKEISERKGGARSGREAVGGAAAEELVGAPSGAAAKELLEADKGDPRGGGAAVEEVGAPSRAAAKELVRAPSRAAASREAAGPRSGQELVGAPSRAAAKELSPLPDSFATLGAPSTLRIDLYTRADLVVLA